MEFFRDAYSVRLLGHTDKYLWASDDKKSVSQKKGKDSYGVIWRVELIEGRNAIRLKGVYDLYLKASDMAFLLGATGKKVMQSYATKADSGLEWEPVSAGTFVKLRTNGNKFLRANGGMPPYRNSITHDLPVLANNQHVVLWDVEVVRKREAASLPPSRLISPRVSNASRPSVSPPPEPRAEPRAEPRPKPEAESSDDDDNIPVTAIIPIPRPRTTKIKIPPTPEDSSSASEPASPIASHPPRRRAALTEESLPPRRRGSPPSEPVRNVPQRRRESPPLDARQGDSPLPRRRAPDADYDPSPPPRRRASPSRDSTYDASPPPRRRASPSRDSTYDASPPPRRRASPSRDSTYDASPPPRRQVPPSRNSNYDHSPPPRRRASPLRDSTYDHSPPPRRRTSLSGDSTYDQSPPPRRRTSLSGDSTYDQSPPPHRRAPLVDETPAPRTRAPLQDYDSAASERQRRHSHDLDSSSEPSPAPARRSARPVVDYEDSENSARPRSQKAKSPDVRRIFYSVAEDDGQVLVQDDETPGNFIFKGHGLEDLTEDLQIVTGIDEDIILCMRNLMTGNLYKMRLALPPNKAPLNVIVVRSNSHFGRTLFTQTSRQ